MRRIKAFFAGVVGLIAFLLLFEMMIPTTRGITAGIFSILWTTFKSLFLTDTIWTTILFALLAFGLFGTVYGLSMREERKVWSIAGAIVSTISAIALFVR